MSTASLIIMLWMGQAPAITTTPIGPSETETAMEVCERAREEVHKTEHPFKGFIETRCIEAGRVH